MTVGQFINAVEKEQGPLRRFLRILCRGDGAKADDIAQEALLKAYLHFNDFNGRSKFSTWLYRIAFNTFCDWSVSAAAKEKDRESLDTHAAKNVAAETESQKDYKSLYEAIDGLTKDERICILLFYMEERSIVEISTITEMPAGTIKSHLFRARAHLKTKLQTLEEYK